MVTGVGFMIIVESDPCAGSPTITNVGTPTTQDNGNCAGTNFSIRTSVTLSGSLAAGQTLQYRVHFNTSSTPSYGSWADSGLTASGNYDWSPASSVTTIPNENPFDTYYFDIQFQIVGTDDTTVCDGPDTSASQWVGTLYDCFG